MVWMTTTAKIDQISLMFDKNCVNVNPGLGHLEDDVRCAPLWRYNDHIDRIGQETVATSNFLPGSRHKGSHFGDIGIDHHRKSVRAR